MTVVRFVLTLLLAMLLPVGSAWAKHCHETGAVATHVVAHTVASSTALAMHESAAVPSMVSSSRYACQHAGHGGCHAMSGACCVACPASVATQVPTLSVRSQTVFPPLSTPPLAFLTDGPDRPPRTC
ncbi:hypothetical protein [Aquabacterium sp.]|uniref:hypothetical protein n=1 Tax=Aquabacterium sp. TaxID=1872578 RepID=UPI003BF53F07